LKHTIIDYGVGNLNSLQAGLTRVGLKSQVTDDIDQLKAAQSLILPGVGAFAPAMQKLHDLALVSVIQSHVESGKPLLGICLGMQLLLTTSLEYGTHQGLGVFPGTVKEITDSQKLPHMGWNTLEVTAKSPLLEGITSLDYTYFVHSFYADTPADYWLATTSYGSLIPAIIQHQSVVGMQFHPEKSGRVGEQLLKNYGRWTDDNYS